MAIINNRNIGYIRDAFSHFYPDNPADFVDGKYQSGDFSWKNRKDFVDFVFNETKILIKSSGSYSDIKAAQQAFEKRALSPETPAERTTPENLKTLEEAAAKKESARQETVKAAEKTVREAIDAQQKNYEKLQANKQKVFVKADEPRKPQISAEAQKFIDGVRRAPKESVALLTGEIEKSITPAFASQLTKEQIHLIAEDAAFRAVDAAVSPQKYIDLARQSAILLVVAKDEAVLPKLIADTGSLAGIRTAATELGTFQDLQTLTPRTVFTAFNPELAKSLFPNPGDFQISLSETQVPGYTSAFNPADLTKGYVNFLGNQATFFAKLGGLPVDKVQSELIGKAGGWLEGQVAANFPQAAAFFSAPESRLIFAGLGIGAPITIELPATMATFFVENSAALPAINFLGGSLGINFSVGSTAGAVAAETAAVAGGEAVAVAGAVGVEAAAGGAAGAATGAAAGSVVPVVGTVIGAVVGLVGPKIIKLIKDNVPKFSKFIVAGMGAALGAGIGVSAGIGAVTGGIVGGLGGFGAASFLSGGVSGVQASLSGLGSGISGAAGIIWTTFLAGIGTPILAFLIGFPIIVALILFIINSGAYVVPPSPYDITGSPGGIGIVCTDEKGPVGVDGPNSTSPIANRAWKITHDLYQGFWCYWNRSPKAPAQYFPNDTLKYPPGYPNAFDYEAFKRNPNTTPPSGNLFWCTYLVIKAYSESGNSMRFTGDDVNSQSMFDSFNKNNRAILPSKATPGNIVPGSVVFFQVHGPGHPPRINHVGVVYSVDPGGLVFVQSNAGLKSQSLNYKPGFGFENIGPMELKGFGLP